MLDYYSNFPSPSKEEAIKEVLKEFKDQPGAEQIITENIMKRESLGSHTGWYVSIKKDVIKEVKISLCAELLNPKVVG
jgi:hypothetical protein